MNTVGMFSRLINWNHHPNKKGQVFSTNVMDRYQWIQLCVSARHRWPGQLPAGWSCPPAPRRLPLINVTFDIDANDIYT